MIHHFCFSNRKLTEWALLDILQAVVVVQLKRWLSHFLGAIVTEDIGVFRTSGDKSAIRVLVFSVLSFIIDLLLPFRWTRHHLLLEILVLFSEASNKFLGFPQLLL